MVLECPLLAISSNKHQDHDVCLPLQSRHMHVIRVEVGSRPIADISEFNCRLGVIGVNPPLIPEYCHCYRSRT